MPYVPEFEDQGGALALKCPMCAKKGFEGHIQHQQIETYERNEDKEVGTYVSIKGEDVKIDKENTLTGNPSNRRSGIAITFWCDNCHATSRLELAQHKGQTLVDFKVTKE